MLLWARTNSDTTSKVLQLFITLPIKLADIDALVTETMASLDIEIFRRVSVPKFLWPLVFRNNSEVLRRGQSIRYVCYCPLSSDTYHVMTCTVLQRASP